MANPQVRGTGSEVSGTSGARRGSRLTLVFGVAVLLVALALGYGWWVRAHPTAFADTDVNVDLPLQVGETGYFAVAEVPDGVHLYSAEPLSVTGEGRVVVRACSSTSAVEMTAVRGAPDRYCTLEDSLAGLTSNGHLMLLVEVTSDVVTEVRVEGLRLKYRDGGRRGLEDIDVVVVSDVGHHRSVTW